VSILLIQSWLKVGGAELLTLHLARALVQRGHRVSIACAFVDVTSLDKELLQVRVIQPWRWIATLCRTHRLFFVLLGCPALIATVVAQARKYDLLNPHNFPSFWAAHCASLLFGTPVVWHFNEPAPVPRFLQRLDGLLINRTRAITVLDDRSRARVKTLFHRDATVVRAGVDFSFWSHTAEPIAEDRYRLSGRVVLLSVGKIHRQKNQALLVDAVQVLRHEIPGLTLVLTGAGPHRKALERRVQDAGLSNQVVFTGMVDSPTLRRLYRDAFMVCFPALDQTWGLTPFEALCQKTVSLVSSQCGVAEVLGPERIGLIAAPDADELARAIRFAHDNPAILQELAERGLAFTRAQMSWERCADAMLQVFSQTVEGSPRTAA